MGKAKVTLALILSFAALILFAITFQQYSSYLKQRGNLLLSDEQNRQLLKEIEQGASQQETLSRQLAEVSQRYDTLRQQLPSELQLDDFKRQLEGRFKAKGLKVLAQREAHYSRPFYREVRLSYSLKGSVKAVQQVLAQIKKQPRLVVSSGAEKESDENTGLTISIFSVQQEEEQRVAIPECLGEPEGVWFPSLKEELALLYSDYSRTCSELTERAEFHRDMQHYRHLKEAVLYLEHIRDSLTKTK